ncbi:serpin I2 isoform X1 [Pelodiscus sinensis]|uniref:serpin I2 isoform X1 n=1 Tax=Pelodiscus sinensis TaxID=13735 RepID=UPI0003C4D101|nr:serpin I2 [Pelodiscus sinensis]XP_025042860.1 serpin I2 [Pelodiscus sinensis]|eukprot:XP_006127839.1 serpin I2 [Pelodiscus sinensis]
MMRSALFQSLLLITAGTYLTCSPISNLMADSTTHLAVDLYQVLHCFKENIIHSPLGTALLLGMIQLGAKGKALNEIRHALNLQGNEDSEEFSLLLQTLFSVTSEKKEFTFNLANALYLQEGFIVKEQYLHSNKEFFQAAIKLVNFQDPKACAETISTWVENKTDGKIKNIVSSEEFGPLTRLILVNAIYFKGDWKQKFRQEATHDMDFTKRDGSVIKIPMMHLQMRTKFGHFSGNNVHYQVLELPYKGKEFSLVLTLPSEDVSIEEVEKLITAQLVKDWFADIQEEDVEISLPRFKMEQTVNLQEILHSLNVTEIFNGGCDLSGITESSEIHVSKAIQKVCIEVNEDGSEAAASSSTQMAAIMSMSHNQFAANRPFLFILKHNPTGSIVFMGRLANPEIENTRRRDMESL